VKYFRWVGHVACTGGRETHTGFRLGNLKRQLGRPSHRWEDIKRVFRDDVDWFNLALVNTVIYLWFHKM